MSLIFSLLLCLFPQESPQAKIFEGAGRPSVPIPRIDAEAGIDGRLDEPPWSQAVRLAGFSQYRPVDGRPAEEKTEILVWYSPSAMYFGVLAFDSSPGSIRATVAERDSLDQDDSVTIYLDTFDDRRRAFFFTVNPLGVQEDGVLSEGAFNPGSYTGGFQNFGGTMDRNPDYTFDSSGRITDEGYVVEIRIPFKSLRYPGKWPQRWGLNIVRKNRRTSYEDTWTDARRAGASFLAQAGRIEGLHDLKRGVVTEIQPFITGVNNGTRDEDGSFHRGNVDLNPGANAHFGFSSLSLDATVNPDFSQVETDAGLVTVNERFALFYPEKRPFFLEGIELFATPNQLVYTRQIVDPIAGGKVTGKVGPFGIAYLGALDDTGEDHALFNVARLRRDFGGNSVAGITYTDRSAPDDTNRVLAADARVVFAKLYYVQGQIGQSWSDRMGDRRSSPIWTAEFDRTGRAWGFNYKLNGIGESFESLAGYVPRNNIVEGHAFNRFSLYGDRGAPLESFSVFVSPMRIWNYRGFGQESAIEGSDPVNLSFQLRGGWNLTGRASRSFVRFDPARYEGYEVVRPDGSVEAYQPLVESSGNYGMTFSMTTPTFRAFNGRTEFSQGESAIFPEASEGRETRATVAGNFRPTDTVRIEASTIYSRLVRKRDGSEFARTIIPRLKIEYQPKKSLFFRVIGEYRSQRQAPLEDARTGDPLLIDGSPAVAQAFNGLRIDLLAAYEPTPGTVAYFGYGSSLQSDRTFGLSDLQRTSDGFFVKLAYLFRR
jgi:hypothetical protein